MPSCTQTRLINLQPTFMNTCLPVKSNFKRRTKWLVQHSISIKDAKTPLTTKRTMDPPLKSIKSSTTQPRCSSWCIAEVYSEFQKSTTRHTGHFVVHCDCLKLFHEQPPTSNVYARHRRSVQNIPRTKYQQQEQGTPAYDKNQRTWKYPYHAIFQQPPVILALLAQSCLLRPHP